jgi:hypothetical protein
MALLSLALAAMTIVVVGAYAAVRGIAATPKVRIPRAVSGMFAIAFAGLLPAAAVCCVVMKAGPDDVPHLWHAVALVWSLMLVCWTAALHRAGASRRPAL